jgi:hypothetical protein
MTKLGRGSLVLASLALLFAGACKNDQFKGAEAEVGKEKINPDMPKIPDFKLDEPEGDVHFVKELRVKNRKYFDQEVKVKGVVTWIYDCATDLQTPDMTPDQVKKLIDEDPMRCHKPQFRLGESADAGEEQTIKVVEVPRAPTALEKKNGDKKQLADPTMWPPVPPLKVGDEVIVDGDWKQRAPHGDSNMEGLLVYKSMTNTTENWDTATALAAPAKKGK